MNQTERARYITTVSIKPLVTGASKIDARFLLAISDALETIRLLFEERIKCHCVSCIYTKPRASRSLPNARSSRVTRRKIANNCGRERILSARFKEREREKKKLSIDEKSCEQRAIQWTVALHPMLLTYDRHTNQTNYPARACPAFSNPCPCKMIIRAACCYLRRFRV